MVSFLFAMRSTADLYSVISHLSVGAHAVEEEAFQSTMKYIFKFIEKVSHHPAVRNTVLTSHTGETSREHRRETLSAFPSFRGTATMA